MTKPHARFGDLVFNGNDYHFWQGGVPVVGMILAVSEDTFTNDRGVALADPDLKSPHVACSGAQNFYVEQGAQGHFVNDKPVGRSGDPTWHCGSAPPGSKGSVLPICSLDTFSA